MLIDRFNRDNYILLASIPGGFVTSTNAAVGTYWDTPGVQQLV